MLWMPVRLSEGVCLHIHASTATAVLKEKKEEYLYSAFILCLVSRRSDMDHTVLPANYTMWA